MSQTIATTAGQSYTFSGGWRATGTSPTSSARRGTGQQVFDRQDIPVQGYVQYSFTVQATGSSTVIQFGYRDDPGYLSMDDVA